MRSLSLCVSVGALVLLTNCALEPEGNDTLFLDTGFTTFPGDGDGDGETAGDGDGDGGDADGDADDGDGDAGDGDGDAGDGDGDTGDGDGGDGDGDSNSCSVPDPGWGATAQVGQLAPQFSGINQHGEQVSICEYEGLPIVIDTSAVWCGPCQMMSQCLGGNDNACATLFGDPQVVDFLFEPLRLEIATGTFAWVTVLTENVNGGSPSINDAVAWDNAYPVYNVWVIPDESQQYPWHLQLMAYPTISLINPQMRWQDLNKDTVFNSVIGYL